MYLEYLVDGRIAVECRKFFLELGFGGDAVSYQLTGILIPFGSREISRGKASPRGVWSIGRVPARGYRQSIGSLRLRRILISMPG